MQNSDCITYSSSNLSFSKGSEISLSTKDPIKASNPLTGPKKISKPMLIPNKVCSSSKPSNDQILSPSFQINCIEKLFSDLQSNTSQSYLIKQKLIEKARETLDGSTLPPPEKIVPFFHFDDFGDVHFSFLIHTQLYSPWFSMIENYFGAKMLTTNKDIYNIVYETYLQSTGLNQSENYDVVIDVDYDEDAEPNFIIISKELIVPIQNNSSQMKCNIKKEDRFDEKNELNQKNNSGNKRDGIDSQNHRINNNLTPTPIRTYLRRDSKDSMISPNYVEYLSKMKDSLGNLKARKND